MTPNEILEKLKKMGVEISPRTLQNYVAWDLVDAPITKSMGRAKGRVAKYEDDAFAKIYAAYRLMNVDYKLTNENVKETAFNALYIIHGATYNDKIRQYVKDFQSGGHKYISLLSPVDRFVFLWIFYYCQALENKLYSKANVVFSSNKDLSDEPKLNITVDRPLEDNLKYGIIKIHLKDCPAVITFMEVSDYNNINLPIVNEVAGGQS